jgi:hypothetical protein
MAEGGRRAAGGRQQLHRRSELVQSVRSVICRKVRSRTVSWIGSGPAEQVGSGTEGRAGRSGGLQMVRRWGPPVAGWRSAPGRTQVRRLAAVED